MNQSPWRRLTYPLYSALRWVSWGVKWGVIWPLATMMLFTLFLMWQDNTTPGQMMAQEAERVRSAAGAGLFPVSDCTVQPDGLPAKAAAEKILLLQEDCPEVLVTAAGYAASLDRSLLLAGRTVWVTLALVYAGLAVVTGNIPSKTLFHRRSGFLYRQPDGSFRGPDGRTVAPRGMGEYLVRPGVTERDEQLKTVYSGEDAATLMENTNVRVLYKEDSVTEKQGKKKDEQDC